MSVEENIISGRNRLRSVIIGTVTSFMSRNNDMWGYWGIGVLCSKALKLNISQMSINILDQNTQPMCAHDPINLQRIYRRFKKRLDSLNIPIQSLQKALMTLRFSPKESVSKHGYSAHCFGIIVDDRGVEHVHREEVFCFPHNPQNESRSSRGEYRPCFLIIGATGYTGTAVVEQLRKRNIDTIAHIRPNSPNREKMETHFHSLGAIVDLTPWQADDFLYMVMKHKPTHVFSLIGTTKAKAQAAQKQGQIASYEAIDRDLSLLLLQTLEKAAEQFSPPQPILHYLFLSSMGVHRDTSNRYLRARADVEKKIRQSHLPWLIAQPSFISGPDREESRPLERLGSIIGDGLLATLSSLGIKKPYQLYGTLSALELATCLIDWALDSTAYKQILNTERLRIKLSQKSDSR